jgi:hypothetical protein
MLYEVLKTVRFQVLMAVTMKNVVLRNATPSGPCINRPFGAKYSLHH